MVQVGDMHDTLHRKRNKLVVNIILITTVMSSKVIVKTMTW